MQQSKDNLDQDTGEPYMMAKPNFLIFCVDQMQSKALGCNGNQQIKTPNIDRIAKEGTRFTRAYCNNSVCMPSRSTMITGLTPRQHGCTTNGVKLPEHIPTITAKLVDHGYRTHCVGKFHYQPGSANPAETESESFSWEDRSMWENGQITSLPPMYYGFQTTDFVGGHVNGCHGDYGNWLKQNHPGTWELYQPENSYFKREMAGGSWRMDVPEDLHYNAWITDRTIDFLEQCEEGSPFFLFCSFPDPHAPFAACRPYSEMYDPDDMILNPTWHNTEDPLAHLADRRIQFGLKEGFDESGLREIMAQTYGMISHVDDCIGRVLAALESNQLMEDTVIVFMADHGEYLGSHHLIYKAEWPYEELLNVPYIWKLPVGAGDLSCQIPVSLLDFAPTVLDLAGISWHEMDTRVGGRASRLPSPGRSLKPYLEGIRSLEEQPVIIEYDEDWHEGPFYRQRIIIHQHYKLVLFPVAGGGLLYDLEKDPNECRNLYEDSNHRHIRAHLTELLCFELIRTDRIDNRRLCGA